MDRRSLLRLGSSALTTALGSGIAVAQSSSGLIKITFSLGPGAAGDVLTRLVADGIAGPKTRAAIAAALAKVTNTS